MPSWLQQLVGISPSLSPSPEIPEFDQEWLMADDEDLLLLLSLGD